MARFSSPTWAGPALWSFEDGTWLRANHGRTHGHHKNKNAWRWQEWTDPWGSRSPDAARSGCIPANQEWAFSESFQDGKLGKPLSPKNAMEGFQEESDRLIILAANQLTGHQRRRFIAAV